LYVISSDISLAKDFSSRFSMLSPFSHPMKVLEKESDPNHPAIIYTDEEKSNMLINSFSSINLKNNEYLGCACPHESILYKELVKSPNSLDHSTDFLMATFVNNIKKIGSRFIRKVVSMSARAPQPKEKMDEQMEAIGFSVCDSPIVKYWTKLLCEESNIDTSSLNCYK
jgi:hypothetical protein